METRFYNPIWNVHDILRHRQSKTWLHKIFIAVVDAIIFCDRMNESSLCEIFCEIEGDFLHALASCKSHYHRLYPLFGAHIINVIRAWLILFPPLILYTPRLSLLYIFQWKRLYCTEFYQTWNVKTCWLKARMYEWKIYDW